MKTGHLLLCSLSVFLGACGGGPDPDAARALAYLNAVRANPAAYSQEIGLDLSGVTPRPPLVWNARLGRSARVRAEDLGKRNYFAHVNPDGIGPNQIAADLGYKFPAFWPKGKANNIEAIHGGTNTVDPVEAIRSLILDKGVNPPGHRIQLLGMNPFFARHRDAGIGIAFNEKSRYKHYVVVHTAEPAPQ